VRVDVETRQVIDRPRTEVAAFAGDPSNAPDWYVNIKTVRWHGEPEVEVGARIDIVAYFMGRQLAYTYEIREHVPGRMLRMSTEEGPFPMETTYEWVDVASGGTEMILRNRGVPTGFGRIAAPMMVAAMRRANGKDLRRLKEILESAGGAAASS
jgi:hypothetical protein